MAAPETYNITIYQGSDYALLAQWLDDDDVPIDLSDFDARMQIRASAHAADTLADFDVDGGDITLDDQGNVRVDIGNAVSSAWTWRRGVYDLELESSGGSVTRLLEGTVTVDPEVTR